MSSRGSKPIWEMDFNALPLRDDRDKRVWELLVCDRTGEFKQTRYCSNQDVNSVWVGERLQEFLQLAPVPPVGIRVFRSRMSSILKRGCEAAGIPMRPSRRVYALQQWMDQRAKEVYPNETQYTYQPNDVLMLTETDLPDPTPLPDKLRGDRWALVTLQIADLRQADQWPTEFGELFAVDWDQLDQTQAVPGLLIASTRAVAIAAWMSGVEPSSLTVDPDQGLILEAGQTDRYLMARLTEDKLRAEGEGFQARKQQRGGLHFLALQTDLNEQSFAGFWLLKDLDL